MARKKRNKRKLAASEGTPAWVAEEQQKFAASIKGVTLREALQTYHQHVDRLLQQSLDAELAGKPLACAAGCSACCHQPLVVSFIELATIYFSDEPRFTRPRFRKALQQEIARLQRWRAAGATSPKEIATKQWAERRPCVMLAPDGRCSIYEARPFLCRNLFAKKICSFAAYHGFGFGNLAILARSMREILCKRFKLQRFDTPTLDVATSAFFLPEGMLWFLDEAPIDELRPLFSP